MNASYLVSALAFVSTAAVGFAQPPAIPVAVDPDLSIDPDAARAFPAKVQPVLMNLCASCHCRPDHPSAFKLNRVTDGYANAQATSRNLRAAATFVRGDNPALSPLLVKAVSPHGGMKDPPLYGRGHPAFKHLELWANHAILGARVASNWPATSVGPAFSPPQGKAPTIIPASATVEPPSLPPLPAPEAGGSATAQVPPVEHRTNADDPFDPAVFNRSTSGRK